MNETHVLADAGAWVFVLHIVKTSDRKQAIENK